MATKTITIDLDEKTVSYTGAVVALRETASIALINTGSSQAADLVLHVVRRQQLFAECSSFSAGVGQFEGDLDLSDSDLIALFADVGPTDSRQFDLMLWDSSRNRLLINDKITIMNNVYHSGLTAPTEL